MVEKRILAADIQWHITANCINRCKHCYTYGKNTNETIPEKDLTFEQLLSIYEKIKEFENKYCVKFPGFAITGGDPLFSLNGWRLIEMLRKENRDVSILGIPERVDTDTIERIRKLGISFYQVSLDGLEKTHDNIRGKGSFKRTIDAIKLLDESEVEYRIMYTIHNMNQNELIPLIEYLEKINVVGNLAFDFMIGATVQNDMDSPRMVSKEEAVEIVRKYQDKSKQIIQKGGKMRFFYKNGMSRMLNLLDQGYQNGMELMFTGCGIGNHLSILADGTVYPCRRLPIPIGNLLEDSFEEIYLNNSLMKKFRRRENWKDCKDCKYFNMCMGCPAVSYAFTGDPLEKMEYCFLKDKDEKYVENSVVIEEEMLMLRDLQEKKHNEEKSVRELWMNFKKMPNMKEKILNRER